ncbi:hypothetical protein HMPREF3038_01487 [Akkermansia sp. KLE1797]|nr:hypothetical protein HMPREF3038_01487 [Akkermansia sp. KLE1797]KXU53455.1 hypothetical protein HMPREF3039_02360 [Akkermansia sp. KLE1798]KZA04561.1 hypothetical protein HMPREF1326_01747 [Akkermansia sp. KLE1605]
MYENKWNEFSHSKVKKKPASRYPFTFYTSGILPPVLVPETLDAGPENENVRK